MCSLSAAVFLVFVSLGSASAQESVLLTPDRALDGEQMREGWSVLVRGRRIVEAGPDISTRGDVTQIDLPGTTLLPGLTVRTLHH